MVTFWVMRSPFTQAIMVTFWVRRSSANDFSLLGVEAALVEEF